MELLSKLSLYSHITAGVITLIMGILAIIFNRRDVKRHRTVGNIFFYAMLWICISTIFGWLKHINEPFYQFLLGIAAIVFCGIMTGYRAIQFRHGAQVNRFDIGLTVFLGISGAIMLLMAAWHFYLGTMIAIPILFNVFGFGALTDTYRNYKRLSSAHLMNAQAWLAVHVSSMLGAFTASTTAFTVNAAHFLPWYLQWFGPMLLLLPLQIYWARQLKPKSIKTQNI